MEVGSRGDATSLRVCQKSFVKLCKREKYRGSKNYGQFYGGKSASLVSLYPAALTDHRSLNC
jgi:hypothetical protein